MNHIERIKMIKAMEYIARHINDEDVFDMWLSCGVADGDIQYGDLKCSHEDVEDLDYYMDDKNYKELIQLFLRCMAAARKFGGLLSDTVVS